MIDAVVFDVGGVLIDWDPRHLFEQFFDDAAELDRFLADVWTPAENDRCDRGRPFAAMIAELSSRHPRHAAAIAASAPDARWIEMIGGPIPGAVELLDDLRTRGLRLYGLSNFSAETFPLVRHRYECFERLADVVISGELDGIAKPDPAIFELISDRHGLVPERTVFVDDSVRNVDAATALGYRAVRFLDTESLRAVLVDWGLFDHGYDR